MDDYEQAFADFASLLASDGTLIIRGDDPGAGRVLDRLDVSIRTRTETFGLSEGLDWTLSGEEGAWRMQPPRGDSVEIQLYVPGVHNALNALAAIATMAGMGIEPGDAARGIAAYRGIGRRFEIKGTACDVLVIDDYAHHPTELSATLRAALDRFPERRVWAVFQPHTFSRTSALLNDFARALQIVKHRVVLDVYGAREKNEGTVTDDDMRRLAGEGGFRAADPQAACELLLGLVKPGDVVLTLGAGDVTMLGPALLDRFEQECPNS
jgi:UDP-N-acetylmuramate--alanine ligase